MKKFLVIAAFVTLATTMPATAQANLGADSDLGTNRLDDPNYGWPP
jgi:hypothetical protein